MMLLPLVNPHEPSVCREDPAPLKASTPVRIRLGAPINQRLNAYRNSPREFHFSGMLPLPRTASSLAPMVLSMGSTHVRDAGQNFRAPVGHHDAAVLVGPLQWQYRRSSHMTGLTGAHERSRATLSSLRFRF